MTPSLSSRWLIAIVVTAMIILLIGGVWFYREQQQELQQQAEDELQVVAQLKVDQIVAWRAERLGDAALLAESPLFVEGVAHWLINPQPEDAENILTQFRALKTHYNYHTVELVDVNGKILLSLTGEGELLHEEAQKMLAVALLNHQPMLTDLYPGLNDLPPHIGAIAPLFTSTGPDAEPIGAIILQSDADQFLYPMIQSWPTPSRSAETLLVRQDGDSVLFLNELRHQRNTALTLRLPLTQGNLPAAWAIQGYEGITQGKDYRGVEVVAAVQAIPDSPWFIVSKVDKAEIIADWRLYSRLIWGLLVGAVVTVSTVGGAVWQRKQKKHYHTLLQAEKAHQESEARYQTTLLSIGDGVIVTDTEEHVILLNPVAQSLTGWTQREALGKPLKEVFRIINEETRQTVDNPVRRVMREGIVVGLANHTLLISKDGRDIPIADSGAPIRNAEEQVVGAVLVFRDQTEERAAQKALEESEAYLRSILDNLPVGVAVNSVFPKVTFNYINDNFLKCYRTTREALAEPDSFWEAAYQDPEYREAIRSKILEDIASGDPARMYWEDVPITRAGKETSFLSARNTPIHGTPLMLSAVWDTTERKRAEEKLRESEERFRRAVADAPFPMLIHAEDGEIVVINQVWTEITGYTHADIPTIDAWTERAYGERKEIVQADIDRLYGMQGRLIEGEYVITTHSGEKRTWDFSSSPVGRLPDGRRLVLSMAMDVTERKHAEDLLRRQNQYLLSLQETSFDLVSELDLDQLLENIVQRAADLAGTSAGLLDLIDSETNQLLPKVGLGALSESLKFEVRPGEGVVGIVWKTGQPLIIDDYDNWPGRLDGFGHTLIRSIIGVPLLRGSQIMGVLGLAYDTATEGTFGPETIEILTQFAQLAAVAIENARLFSRVEQELRERKRAEQELRENQEKLEILFEILPVGVSILDQERKLVHQNPALEKILEVSREGLLRGDYRNRTYLRSDGTPMPPEEFASNRVFNGEAVAHHVETGVMKENGATIWTSVSAVACPIADWRVAVVTADITARKQAELAVRRYAERLAAINRLDRIISSGLDISRVYDSFVKELQALIPLEQTSIVLLNETGDQWRVARQWTQHQPAILPNEWRPTEGSAVAWVATNRDPFLENEIGERGDWKETPLLQRAGLRSRLLLPLIIHERVIGLLTAASHEPSAFSEEDQHILMTIADQLAIAIHNSRLFEQVQHHAAELEQRVIERTAELSDLYNHAPCGYHSLDGDGIFERINDTELEWLGYTREEIIGKLAFSDLLTPSSIQTFDKNFPVFKERGWVRDLEFEMVRKDGSTLPVLLSATAIYNEEGQYLTSRSTMVDHSERKRAEEALRQRTAQLEASNRELEAFSYSVSHDLRAPLRAIDGFSRMVLRDYAPLLPEDGQRRLQTVRDNAQRMGQLIDDLLAFSRLGRQPIQKRTVSPKSLVQTVLEGLRSEYENRQVDITIGDLPDCQADPALLKQVFVNLLSNAIKFTSPRKIALIEVGVVYLEGQSVYFVKDNGVGFDMQYADKLFGVFQRLHQVEEFEGTGVGLAIVQRIINRHGGRVWAKSQIDQGTTFYFTAEGESAHE